MKIFIDFDDVIFNTKEFSLYLKDFYVNHGVSQELVQKHYYDPSDNNPVRLFDPEGLFSRLEKNENFDLTKLRENFYQQIKNLSSFVFSDVEDFLIKMGRENIYMVSFGLPDFQNKKIIGSGVNELVSGCIVTRGLKSEAIEKIIRQISIDFSEKMIFIDDRVEQIEEIKKNFPQMLTFLLCRKEGRYCDKKNDYCDYYVESLDEIVQIILKLN